MCTDHGIRYETKVSQCIWCARAAFKREVVNIKLLPKGSSIVIDESELRQCVYDAKSIHMSMDHIIHHEAKVPPYRVRTEKYLNVFGGCL